MAKSHSDSLRKVSGYVEPIKAVAELELYEELNVFTDLSPEQQEEEVTKLSRAAELAPFAADAEEDFPGASRFWRCQRRGLCFYVLKLSTLKRLRLGRPALLAAFPTLLKKFFAKIAERSSRGLRPEYKQQRPCQHLVRIV